MTELQYDAQTGKTAIVDIPDEECPIYPAPDMTPRAPKTINKGEYFYLDGELCKAKVHIADGALLIVNTNYQITTVENELSALNK